MFKPDLVVQVVAEPDPCIRLAGELDLRTAPRLVRALAELDGCDVVVDCTDLTFLDSTGISALVQAHNLRQGEGRRIAVRGISGVPLRALEISGLLATFGIPHRNGDGGARA